MSGRLLWIDASAGVAGDMLLAALLDLGADAATIRAGLVQVLAAEDWALRSKPVHRGAFRALLVDVVDHHEHHHEHAHRPWRWIRERLVAAAIPARARARALAAYGRLAAAEAKLHGQEVDDVVLHEVGALDSIVDVVGVCLALEDLDVERIVATPLPMGTGRIASAHGALPLPAPATLDVLSGWPIVPSEHPGEWVTPTGAALVAALAEPGPPPPMRPLRTGWGAGHRDPAHTANVVRAVLGEPLQVLEHGVVCELAANVDDMPGEHVPVLLERLLEAGALDAWAAPSVGKKGRPGLVIGALCAPTSRAQVGAALLRHSSSLGLRWSLREREVLERTLRSVPTRFGAVLVKEGWRGSACWQRAVEHDDALRVALAHGVSLAEVSRAALAAAEEEA